MISNTSDKARQVSMLLKIAAGLFVLTAIMDSVDYFNYTSYALSLVNFIVNIITLVFLAVVMFSMKGFADQENNQGSSKFTLAGVGLIVYPIVLSVYYFSFSEGFFIMIFLLFARGIAFSLIYVAFKTLQRKMESWIYPLYGFTQLIFFGIFLVLYFMWLDDIADVVGIISYWLDTLLIFGVAIVLFLGSNKITSAPRAVPSTAQPYSPGTIYTPYQPPVQQPTQPIQYEALPKCSNCGDDLEPGAKFCTNCGATTG